ncbi:LTA synthase family protein [Arthrobacter sp. EH-1B-1]|uniref:LTA synthase family protein n=1 Tax=Arthrobacter vasquezii TaxID=2977629 RepID=A0ABT6CQK4_9MICC|nr:LTA synthase family protein [Arthrobacter vasquezii]MDF9276382.1 LTA synthase family protein [Arthrobacter vasquezii]
MLGSILSVTRRAGTFLGRTCIYALIWAGLALLIAAAIIRSHWGEISVGQMLLNLVSVETDGGGGPIIWIAVLGIGVVPLLITAGIALWRYARHRRRRNKTAVIPPRSQWIMNTVSGVLVAGLVVAGTTSFASTVSLWDYIKAANSSYDIGNYYVEPTVTGDALKRNLVLIYLESGEGTIADDQLFEKDAFASLKEVTKASDGWQSVESLREYKGGGWTMAGLVSTQCGIPLKGTSSAMGSGALNSLGGEVDTYLGGATCLGDLLDEQGYKNVFLGGANASFAAKDVFLSSHGYSEIKDLSDWRAAGEPENNFRSDWGLSDERLMAYAKDEIDVLHAEAENTGQPFNLTMLTLDTHAPLHIYDYCDVDTENATTSVFACSMTQVAGFVDHMKEKGYLDDTAVVIMGDHLKQLTTGDPFEDQLGGNDNRTIFNRIWIPGADSSTIVRSEMDQLSLYPTIVEVAGLTLQDQEAGLGVSAFAPSVPADSAQAMNPDAYAELLDAASAQFYAEAWAGEPAIE